MSSAVCAVCTRNLSGDSTYLRCHACGAWRSTLQPRVLDEQSWQALDEQQRGDGLRALREENFLQIVDQLKSLVPSGKRLLDVGAAHGWFVKTCQAAGIDATGLEPDPRLAAFARQTLKESMIEGFFPDALTRDLRFDAISFNDVFEHLPEPERMMHAIASHLNPGGVLILNLPLASGFFFRVAHVLHKLGLHGPWNRLWQVDFPSPHLFYFTTHSLTLLAQRTGFELIHQSRLKSLSSQGLWARLRMDATQPVWRHALQWIILRALIPLLSILPADIGLMMFRKKLS